MPNQLSEDICCRSCYYSAADGSLQTDQAVIRLDDQGTPRVSYSPRLVALIQEVRQLRVLGLTIPAPIEEIDAQARLYFRQAKVRRIAQMTTPDGTV